MPGVYQVAQPLRGVGVNLVVVGDHTDHPHAIRPAMTTANAAAVRYVSTAS